MTVKYVNVYDVKPVEEASKPKAAKKKAAPKVEPTPEPVVESVAEPVVESDSTEK